MGDWGEAEGFPVLARVAAELAGAQQLVQSEDAAGRICTATGWPRAGNVGQ